MISYDIAEEIFRVEVVKASTMPVDPYWVNEIEHFSQLCIDGRCATHIAFLGTAILAKAVDADVNLKQIKPTHSTDAHAYTARTLCHTVLVPLSAELGVNIGVNGREPLNNQPYFRMKSLGDGTPVSKGAVPAFAHLLKMIDELQTADEKGTLDALRAFIAVRSKYKLVYGTHTGDVSISAKGLSEAIATLVSHNSEGGKRAQAAVAGIFDVFAGPGRVESGRINDPSRHYPGDVAVKTMDGRWEKAVEVRDKKVTEADVYIFARICMNKGVYDMGMVLASPKQERFDESKINEWASQNKVGITIFFGWEMFVEQALFWAGATQSEALINAVKRVEQRLIAVEASATAVDLWHSLTRT